MLCASLLHTTTNKTGSAVSTLLLYKVKRDDQRITFNIQQLPTEDLYQFHIIVDSEIESLGPMHGASIALLQWWWFLLLSRRYLINDFKEQERPQCIVPLILKLYPFFFFFVLVAVVVLLERSREKMQSIVQRLVCINEFGGNVTGSVRCSIRLLLVGRRSNDIRMMHR